MNWTFQVFLMEIVLQNKSGSDRPVGGEDEEIGNTIWLDFPLHDASRFCVFEQKSHISFMSNRPDRTVMSAFYPTLQDIFGTICEKDNENFTLNQLFLLCFRVFDKSERSFVLVTGITWTRETVIQRKYAC